MSNENDPDRARSNIEAMAAGIAAIDALTAERDVLRAQLDEKRRQTESALAHQMRLVRDRDEALTRARSAEAELRRFEGIEDRYAEAVLARSAAMTSQQLAEQDRDEARKGIATALAERDEQALLLAALKAESDKRLRAWQASAELGFTLLALDAAQRDLRQALTERDEARSRLAKAREEVEDLKHDRALCIVNRMEHVERDTAEAIAAWVVSTFGVDEQSEDVTTLSQLLSGIRAHAWRSK